MPSSFNFVISKKISNRGVLTRDCRNSSAGNLLNGEVLQRHLEPFTKSVKPQNQKVVPPCTAL